MRAKKEEDVVIVVDKVPEGKEKITLKFECEVEFDWNKDLYGEFNNSGDIGSCNPLLYSAIKYHSQQKNFTHAFFKSVTDFVLSHTNRAIDKIHFKSCEYDPACQAEFQRVLSLVDAEKKEEKLKEIRKAEEHLNKLKNSL